MISFRQKGDFSKLTRYFERVKYGREGVAALMSATPVDSGKTASSWYYEIDHSQDSASINFYNSNVNKGVLIAIILQYGHGTRNGGWVQGRDYINPAMQPLFDKFAEDAWREVTSA